MTRDTSLPAAPADGTAAAAAAARLNPPPTHTHTCPAHRHRRCLHRSPADWMVKHRSSSSNTPHPAPASTPHTTTSTVATAAVNGGRCCTGRRAEGPAAPQRSQRRKVPSVTARGSVEVWGGVGPQTSHTSPAFSYFRGWSSRTFPSRPRFPELGCLTTWWRGKGSAEEAAGPLSSLVRETRQRSAREHRGPSRKLSRRFQHFPHSPRGSTGASGEFVWTSRDPRGLARWK
eukprot:356143-Chlamydomonas_euryale.AAC.1